MSSAGLIFENQCLVKTYLIIRYGAISGKSTKIEGNDGTYGVSFPRLMFTSRDRIICDAYNVRYVVPILSDIF